jgi:hypothetical protein
LRAVQVNRLAINLGGAMRRVLSWFFRNRETGAITIAQMPNPALWIVIVGTVLIWAWRPAGRIGTNLECLVGAALVVWAIDEVLRGVNPWRRCLGAAVLVYEVATIIG